MKECYHGRLGLPLVQERRDKLTIAGGSTHITFVHVEVEGDRPFYHFAFNIPENKVKAASE